MTDQDIKNHYADKENCYAEIREARQLFGNKNTTEGQYDQMQRALAFMFLYCPKEIQSVVQATMNEAEARRFYFTLTWAKAS